MHCGHLINYHYHDEFGDDDNDYIDDNCIDMMPACSAVHCGHLVVIIIIMIMLILVMITMMIMKRFA